jgi:hypothetical protein
VSVIAFLGGGGSGTAAGRRGEPGIRILFGCNLFFGDHADNGWLRVSYGNGWNWLAVVVAVAGGGRGLQLEGGVNPGFSSYLDAIYFSVTTLTTVGFG